jgi:hypothetical protein
MGTTVALNRPVVNRKILPIDWNCKSRNLYWSAHDWSAHSAAANILPCSNGKIRLYPSKRKKNSFDFA